MDEKTRRRRIDTCSKCIYYHGTAISESGGFCLHPEVRKAAPVNWVEIKMARDNPALCGEIAKYFTPKDLTIVSSIALNLKLIYLKLYYLYRHYVGID